MSETSDRIRAWKAVFGYQTGGKNDGKRREAYYTDDYPLSTQRVETDPRPRTQDDAGVDYRKGSLRPDRPQAITTDEPYEPMKQAFAKSVGRYLRERLVVDQTAAHDQVSGVAYTRERREALLTLAPNHYLALQYGLRTIHQQNRHSDPAGLRIQHDTSSPYLRDDPGDSAKALFATLYEKKTSEQFNAKQVFFLNSPSVIDRLQMIYGPDMGVPAKTNPIIELCEGVHAFTFTEPLTMESPEKKSDWATYFQKHQLHSVGAMPSTYDAIRCRIRDEKGDKAHDNGGRAAPLYDEELLGEPADNKDALGKIGKSQGFTTIEALLKNEPNHPMREMMGAAHAVVSGLNTSLKEVAKTPEFSTNVIVGSALQNLQRLVDTMPAYLHDAPRLSRLFDLLVDEVYLLLGTCQPYQAADFKQSANKVLGERAPTVNELTQNNQVQVESFMLANGMDALSSAVALAFKTAGIKKVDLVDKKPKSNKQKCEGQDRKLTSNYFEIEEGLLDPELLDNPNSSVMMLTLNPSTPIDAMTKNNRSGWDVKDVVQAIQKRLQGVGEIFPAPLIVILDITIERKSKPPELDVLFSTFAKPIATEQMVIITCKSYQKYPSLGSGKILSGGVSVIGKGDASTTLIQEFAAAENTGGAHDRDENQLCTHFLTHAESCERPLLDRAARNAAFASKLFEGSDKKDKTFHSDGLPFLVIPGEKIQTDAVDSSRRQTFTKKAIAPMEMLWAVGVEERMSFGFHATSCLPMPGGMRVALGQESESELVEKMFVVGKLSKRPASYEPKDDFKVLSSTFDVASNEKVVRAWMTEGEATAKGKAKPKIIDRNRMIDRVINDVMSKLDGAKVFKGQFFDGKVVADELRHVLQQKLEGGEFSGPLPAKPTAKVRAAYQACLAEAGKIVPKYMKTGVSVSDVYALAQEAGNAAGAQAQRLICFDMRNEPEAWKVRVVQVLLDAKCGKSRKDLEGLSADKLLSEIVAMSSKDAKEAPMAGLKRQLRFVQACSRPSTSMKAITSSDAPQIVASQKREWRGAQPSEDDLELKYLPNVCASCALMAMNVFDDPANDTQVAEMTDLLMQTSMNQVSPEARQQLLVQRVILLGKADPTKTNETLATQVDLVESCVQRLPYSEGAAKILLGLPDRAINAALSDDANGQRIVKALFRPLSLEAAIQVLQICVEKEEPAKSKAAATYIQEVFTAISDGKYDSLPPALRRSRAKLSDPLGEFGAAPTISEKEVVSLRIVFDKLLPRVTV